MSADVNRVHHVTFCVEPSNLDAARQLWTDLGYEFVDHTMPERGMAVLIDMKRGVEVISPIGPQAGELREFLDKRGEGVFAVVVQTADIDRSLQVTDRHDADLVFRHQAGSGYRYELARITPVYGMPITFLDTDR
ncbi:MAG TPA: VOC family protein [Novosphingobium sp.]|nr:VOC family protein [Novosphingobium sp.]